MYLKCADFAQFLRTWVDFTAPFHKHRVTSREKDVAARLLVQYFKLKDSVTNADGKTNEDTLYELMWTRRSRKDMMDSLQMSQAHFQSILATLKTSGFLNGTKIEQRFIPNISPSEKRLFLGVVFDMSSKDNSIQSAEE